MTYTHDTLSSKKTCKELQYAGVKIAGLKASGGSARPGWLDDKCGEPNKIMLLFERIDSSEKKENESKV
jgi:hypothetical protein